MAVVIHPKPEQHQVDIMLASLAHQAVNHGEVILVKLRLELLPVNGYLDSVSLHVLNVGPNVWRRGPLPHRQVLRA